MDAALIVMVCEILRDTHANLMMLDVDITC